MFKIALTPLLAPPQTRMYPLRCPSGRDAEAGPGRPGLPPPFAERAAAELATRERAAPGPGSPTVAAQGGGHPGRSRAPNPQSGKAGSALSGPPLRA